MKILIFFFDWIIKLNPCIRETNQSSVKKFTEIYKIRMFISAFTRCHYFYIPCATLIQSITLHPTSWRLFLILFSHLRLGFTGDLFLSGLAIRTVHAPVLSPIHATSLAHLILLDSITRNKILWPVQIIKLLIMYFSLLPSVLALLSSRCTPYPHILKHPRPTSPLNVTDQVSHPYKTRSKVIVLYSLEFMT